MMRVLLSLAGLLVVFLIVLQLTGRQADSLTAGAGVGAPGTSTPPPTQHVADDVRRAIAQGAASRAAEAASQ